MKTGLNRPESLQHWSAAALLLVVTALLYGHTLNVPMYLDDHGALLENYRLRDLTATLQHFFGQRGLTNLTFALNFRFSGWELPPLHLTNIALHALCGLLVWELFRQIVKGALLPLLGALIFIGHPLQTQAVTYLVQRSAVLAGVFFVAAVLCHRRSGEVLATGRSRRSLAYFAWHAAGVLLGACAVLSKENTAVLPLVLLIHDRLLPQSGLRRGCRLLIDYLPYCVVPLLLGGTLLLGLLSHGQLPRLTSSLVALEQNDPLHYLITQFSVFWIYLRMLLLPYGQALEHNYHVAGELLGVQNVLALAGLVVLGWLSWRLRQRHPLLVFGVAWFALTLVVESSVIPLDPLFEHRLYLPMFGFLLVLLGSLPVLLGDRRAGVLLLAVLLICLPLTWCRNALWKEPLQFNEQNLDIAPDSERVLLALFFNYRDAGRMEDARRSAQQMLLINPRFGLAYEELGLLYAERGETRQALSVVGEGLLVLPGDPGLYKAGAKIHLRAGQPQAALQYLQQGVVAAPRSPAMHDQLAALHFELGHYAEAEAGYRKSLELRGSSASAHRNLGKVLYSQGRMGEALEEVRIALQLEPGNPDTLEGLGMCALALGQMSLTAEVAERLERNDAEAAQRLRAAMSVSTVRGGR